MTVIHPPASSNKLTNLIMLALIAGIGVGSEAMHWLRSTN
jgi:hypothetical protein